MQKVYHQMIKAMTAGEKLLAVLIDPEKIEIEYLPSLFDKINASVATHIFVGGSTDKEQKTTEVVTSIQQLTSLPVILFPGDYSQITNEADGILFLSLISGRNPEYLIEQHVKAAPFLKDSSLEVISTGYLLLDGGKETAVARVSKTKPISQDNHQLIVNTALAGQYSGNQLIYLEAGSGAIKVIAPEIIASVKAVINIPLIVGGGIKTKQQLDNAYKAGADLVVIGTAFEENEDFFNELKK